MRHTGKSFFDYSDKEKIRIITKAANEGGEEQNKLIKKYEEEMTKKERRSYLIMAISFIITLIAVWTLFFIIFQKGV